MARAELLDTYEVGSIECHTPIDMAAQQGRRGMDRIHCNLTTTDGPETVHIDYFDAESGMEASMGNKNPPLSGTVDFHELQTCALVEREDTRTLDCIEDNPRSFYGR